MMAYWILGPVIALGICLSGSDGSWFPWVNLVGFLLVAGSLATLHKLEHLTRKED